MDRPTYSPPTQSFSKRVRWRLSKQWPSRQFDVWKGLHHRSKAADVSSHHIVCKVVPSKLPCYPHVVQLGWCKMGMVDATVLKIARSFSCPLLLCHQPCWQRSSETRADSICSTIIHSTVQHQPMIEVCISWCPLEGTAIDDTRLCSMVYDTSPTALVRDQTRQRFIIFLKFC